MDKDRSSSLIFLTKDKMQVYIKEKNMKKKKSKAIKSIIAVILVLAIILTGTYAWQSISQQAVNKVIPDANPGGRLHDDFNGENKDVYVENFSNSVPIFARIRLDEYMEIGQDAGTNLEDPDRLATPVVENTDVNDMTTWKTYIPEAYLQEGEFDLIHVNYWSWETGGSTVFMPTFNKNKDSLTADINGTFEGPDGNSATDEDRYKDYKDYSLDEEKTANAIYDADTNDVDEGEAAVEDVNYTTTEEPHVAKKTQTGTVITMKEWLEDGCNPGKYWIYDEDGWAYWGELLQPGEATGLLLDSIKMTGSTNEPSYYAINVVAQFATNGDWGDKAENTGFYQDGITDNALLFLYLLGGDADNVADEITIDGIEFYVLAKDLTNNNMLIWSKDILFTQAFGASGTSRWSSSPLRTTLNGTWLSSYNTLNLLAVETTVKTRTTYDSTTFTASQDKVFLLSEADLFGTFAGSATKVLPDDYSYGGTIIPTTTTMRKCSSDMYWLITLTSSTSASTVSASTGNRTTGTKTAVHGVRPALWITLNPQSEEPSPEEESSAAEDSTVAE